MKKYSVYLFVFVVFFSKIMAKQVLSYDEFLQNKISYSGFDIHNVPYDQKLKKHLNFPNGFFIEVGAYDGVKQSNTKIFEDCFGWTGLMVEPSRDIYQRCVKNRPNAIVERYALVSSFYPFKYIKGDFQKGSLVSSVDGSRYYYLNYEMRRQHSVPAITLTKLLDKHNIKEVDFSA